MARASTTPSDTGGDTGDDTPEPPKRVELATMDALSEAPKVDNAAEYDQCPQCRRQAPVSRVGYVRCPRCGEFKVGINVNEVTF